jgi:hypothetical protein
MFINVSSSPTDEPAGTRTGIEKATGMPACYNRCRSTRRTGLCGILVENQLDLRRKYLGNVRVREKKDSTLLRAQRCGVLE